MPSPAPSVSVPKISRLAYIDWMRGLACVLMFQTHCYDSWLRGDARKSTFFMWSQLGGTLPAPLFLFLAGISFALVTDKMTKAQFSAALERACKKKERKVIDLVTELQKLVTGRS